MGLYFVNRSTPNYDTILCRQICTGLLRRQQRGHHPTKHVRQPFINTPPTKNGIPTIELSLPLCERVLELHGGSISFSQEGSDLNQITFEIPTGAPAEQSDEHGVEQAQRYAHDLHKLLQNIKQKDRGETK
jgi:hypothetical protein